MYLKNFKFFSVCNMCFVFNQIFLMEDSCCFIGFQIFFGVYQFQRLCFGLKVVLFVFQRVMYYVIGSLGFEYVFIYFDDCFIYIFILEEYLQILEKVFDCFKSVGFIL